MLKKCIVIMVMFALVAGAAFAQITFGGQLMEGMTLFQGNNVTDDPDDPVKMGGTYNATEHEAKFSVLFGDGTAGGRLVWELNNKLMWGWMQWRPNQYFRVKIGKDGDGEWGFPQIIGWGFTGEAKNSVAAVNDYNGSLPMRYRHAGLNYGGFDGNGNFHLGFSIFPVDMLQINFLFRDFDKAQEVSARLATMQISASYRIEEVGTIRFAAVGEGGLARAYEKDEKTGVEKGSAKDGDKVATLHLAFYSNEIVQGLAFEAGAQFPLPRLNEDDTFDNITVGGGINLTMTDPFNLKIRMGGSFGGKTKGEDDDTKVTGFSIGILPSYKLPKMTIFLHAGLGIEENEFTRLNSAEADYAWFINPYIWVPMGGMRMWVGLQIFGQHTITKSGEYSTRDGIFNWNIPFGFNFYF
jgi:hypothetical protein